MRRRDVFVVAMLFMVPIEVSDSREPVRESLVFLDDGDKETLAIGTNTPYLGLHSKYLENSNIIKEIRKFKNTGNAPNAIHRTIIFA